MIARGWKSYRVGMFAPDRADWPQLLKLAMLFTSGRSTIQSGGSAQNVNQRLVVRQESWKDRYQESSGWA